MDTMFVTALRIRESIIENDDFLINDVKTLLDRLNGDDIEVLNCIGLFNYHRIANKDEMETIYEKIKGQTDSLIHFCSGLISAFPTVLNDGNGDIALLRLKTAISHKLFLSIRKPVVLDVLSMFVYNKRLIPSKCRLSSTLLGSILSIFAFDYTFSKPYIDGKEFCSILEGLICLPSCSDDEILNLSVQINELKQIRLKYPNTLFNITFTERLVYLLRKGVFYYEIDKLYPNRCRIMDVFISSGITRNEIMLLAMFGFAQIGEKEENRNFWIQFQKWFGLDESLCKLNTLRNECISSFEGIETIGTGKNRQYVQTSLMHSIVSNRPLSKECIFRDFMKLFRRNGYVGHTNDDIEELVMGMLESSGFSIPTETRDAYHHNPDQTVNFLKEQYGYFETEMLGLLGYEPVLESPAARFAITDYIDQSIAEIKGNQQQIGNMKITAAESRHKAERFHSPFVSIEKEHPGKWSVCIRFGYYNLLDENLKLASEAIVSVDGNPVAFLEVYEDEIIGESIGLNREWIGRRVSISIGEEEIDSFVIPNDLLFDFSMQRLVSRRFMRSCQHYLLVSSPDLFLFDDAICVGDSSIPGFSVYDIVLDENNFILLNGGVVGISSEESKCHDFLDSSGTVLDADIAMVDGAHIPIRKGWPGINLISETDSEVIVNVNGRSVNQKEEFRCELRDGSGRMYRKIVISEMFPNLNVIDFNVVVGGVRRLSERFYALRNFNYSLNRLVLKPNENVVVTEMAFDDKESAFGQKHYTFPGRYETPKFKLNDGNAVVIKPPIFNFSLENGTPFLEEMAASAISNGFVSHCTPSLEKDMRVCIEKDNRPCGWAKKSKGGKWDCYNLIIANKDSVGKFQLVGYSLGERYVICNLYFCPFIADQSIRFHTNSNIRTEREDGVYYYYRLLGVTDLAKLRISLIDCDGRIAYEFNPSSAEMYERLPVFFEAGRYSVVVSEQYSSIRLGKCERTFTQSEVVYEGRPINCELVVEVSDVSVSGESRTRDVKRRGIVFRGRTGKKPNKGDSLSLNGSFHLCNQYMDRLIELRVNPCIATVNDVNGDSISMSVNGRDGKPLKIDERSFLNPENPFGRPREIRTLRGKFITKE